METQPIAPLLGQMLLTKAGLYCSERLSNDIYFLNECIDLLLPTFNLKILKKEFEEIFGKGSWDITIIKRKKILKRLSESKIFYDALSDKSLTKRTGILKSNTLDENTQKIFKKYFYKTSAKISLMQPEIYNLFVFLVNNSQIQSRQIKNEYFKNLEQKDNRKIAMDKKDRSQASGGN